MPDSMIIVLSVIAVVLVAVVAGVTALIAPVSGLNVTMPAEVRRRGASAAAMETARKE